MLLFPAHTSDAKAHESENKFATFRDDIFRVFPFEWHAFDTGYPRIASYLSIMAGNVFEGREGKNVSCRLFSERKMENKHKSETAFRMAMEKKLFLLFCFRINAKQWSLNFLFSRFGNANYKLLGGDGSVRKCTKGCCHKSPVLFRMTD